MEDKSANGDCEEKQNDGLSSSAADKTEKTSVEGDVDDDQEKVVIVPHLSLFSAAAINVGSVVGSGLFISPKGVVAGCGSVGLSMVMWLVCGLISLLGAQCFAEIGAMLPQSGGTFSYLHVMFGDLVAFLYMWGKVVLALPASCALIALLFAEYSLQPFFDVNPLCSLPKEAVWCLAIFSLCVATAVNFHSARLATRVNNVLAICKVASLLIITIAGFVALFQGKTDNFQDAFRGSTYDSLGGALYNGLYSYAGWYAIGLVGGEIKKPEKNLPRAVYLSVLLIIAIVIPTNIAYFVVLSPEEMMQADAVAMTFGSKALGKASFLMPVSVALATLGSLNSSLFSYARLYQAAAAKNHLPKIVSMININRRTPNPAVILISFTILLFIFAPNLFSLINYHSCFTWLFCGAAVLGQVILRFKEPNKPRPYKINILIPISFVVICVFLLIFGTINSPMDTLIGMAIIFSGVPVYYIFVQPRKQLKWIGISSRLITHWMQKLFLVIEEEK
ncbi:Y+L amino acid transporter 2-like isoform X2 [Patiria miniata]|nr:Y+L amino acid transporter 2-like isoform X2 [Patiria miniata]XP_038046052.1 Y+L amino acid transporter 2-like isoform X2 [Patiria miniata]XP_038046053.1 Y+L amino acid transporter 2-like isoform X2 [Patiria miniata]XP_038046054.1 Y+L amino acid transporter 2-like isoform X2 [Patiria miniata]